jgi:hypothetical protein
MSKFIQARTDGAPVYINSGNIVYVSTRALPDGSVIPILFMMNGMILACTGNTLEEILAMLEADDGPKTEIPDAFIKSFSDKWDAEDKGLEEQAEQASGTNETPQVDTSDEDPVSYRDGDESFRNDDDLLPR